METDVTCYSNIWVSVNVLVVRGVGDCNPRWLCLYAAVCSGKWNSAIGVTNVMCVEKSLCVIRLQICQKCQQNL